MGFPDEHDPHGDPSANGSAEPPPCPPVGGTQGTKGTDLADGPEKVDLDPDSVPRSSDGQGTLGGTTRNASNGDEWGEL